MPSGLGGFSSGRTGGNRSFNSGRAMNVVTKGKTSGRLSASYCAMIFPTSWIVSYIATMFSVGLTGWRLWQGAQIQRAPR